MKAIQSILYLFVCLFWQAISLLSNNEGIPDFLAGSLHSQNSMIRSLSGKASLGRFQQQYYYNSQYEPGFVLMQYYSGSRCNGSMTINFGYRNGACIISEGGATSTRIYFENDDCSTTIAMLFSDYNCQNLVESYSLSTLTMCQTNSSRANSFAWSFSLHCFSGPNLPVTMDSVTYTYRGNYSNDQSDTQICNDEILAFQSVATGLCLSAPTRDSSYNLTCSASATEFSLNNFLNDDTCSSKAITNSYQATCPAGYTGSLDEEPDEEIKHGGIVHLTDQNAVDQQEDVQAANSWWIIVGTYSASNTNSATQNTPIFYLYTCPGPTYTVDVCEYSFTGDTYLRAIQYSYGTQIASNDDYCALGSSMTFTPTICDYYQIDQGCYSSGSCSATTTVSAPSGPVVCPYFFSSGYTSTPCTFYACSGTATISTCSANGATVYGSVSLSLSLNGVTVADGVSACGGAGYTITYRITQCGNYQINQYCNSYRYYYRYYFYYGSYYNYCYGNTAVSIVANPTQSPSPYPSQRPSAQPTALPSPYPSPYPSAAPTFAPSCNPSQRPSFTPTTNPTIVPSCQPTAVPSATPSAMPSFQPTMNPSQMPSFQPTFAPSNMPTVQPSAAPTMIPSFVPSAQPSFIPTYTPSYVPSRMPSAAPSFVPSASPSQQPTMSPSALPTYLPTYDPSAVPSAAPSLPDAFKVGTIYQVTECVLQNVTLPVYYPPTFQPTSVPSAKPTSLPSSRPSSKPSRRPSTQPTRQPSTQPSVVPSVIPSAQPSAAPSSRPSFKPSAQPTSRATNIPSSKPSSQPTTSRPSSRPSSKPSAHPTSVPTARSSARPSVPPSVRPTAKPSCKPTAKPSVLPSSRPTAKPSARPSTAPSAYPTNPTSVPSRKPSSSRPSSSATFLVPPSTIVGGTLAPQASLSPSQTPSAAPTVQPTLLPSQTPTVVGQTNRPINPSRVPSVRPSNPGDTSAPQSSLSPILLSQVPTPRPSVQGDTSQPIVSSLPSQAPSFRPSNPGDTSAPQSSSSPILPSEAPSPRPSNPGDSSQPIASNSPIAPSLNPSSRPSLQSESSSPIAPSQTLTTAPSLAPQGGNSSLLSTGGASVGGGLAASALIGIIGGCGALSVLLIVACCYRKGWILGGGRSSSSDGEDSSQASSKENPIRSARSMSNRSSQSMGSSSYDDHDPPLDSPSMLAKTPRTPTYQSRFNNSGKRRSRSQSFHQSNDEVEMSEFATADPSSRQSFGSSRESMGERPSDLFDDGSARRSSFLASSVVGNALADPRRRPMAQRGPGSRNNLTNDAPPPPPPAAVMINKLRPTPKKEEEDLNFSDMYPDELDEKPELHRVSYSDVSGFNLESGMSAEDDFDYRRVKNKWKSQESNVAVKNEALTVNTTSGKAAPPPPPPRSPTASPSKGGIDSDGRANMMKKTDSFFGSNPLARKPSGGPRSPGGAGSSSSSPKKSFDPREDMI